MTPIVNGLEETYGRDFNIVFVDIDTRDGKKLAREHSFIGQPTYVFFNELGEEVRRLQGPQTLGTFQQQIERLLEK